MLRRGLWFAAFSVLSTLVAGPVAAVPTIVLFSGTITSVTDPGGFLDPSIVVGSPFSGSYSIDPALGSPISPQLGGVLYALASPGSTQVSIGAIPFTSDIDSVLVADGYTQAGGGDAWAGAVNLDLVGTINIALVFQDTTGTKLATDDFFVNQELAGWDRAQIFVDRLAAANPPAIDTLAIGTITSVIPEPGTGALLGSGLLLVGARRSVRRRRLRLASCARQAEDDSLRTHATRIQDTRDLALRLKQIQPRKGERTDEPRGGRTPEVEAWTRSR